MTIIDQRTGKELPVNQTLYYDDGSSVSMLNMEPGIMTARFFVLKKDKHGVGPQTVYGRIRWFHPKYPFERVAVYPSSCR